MKKQILSLLFLSYSILSALAQAPIVDKFTNVDMKILATPPKGTVIPTADGGYFMSSGLSLTKYDTENKVVWTQSLTASIAPAPFAFIHKINSICDDGNGGAIITGEFNGTLFYGNDSLTPFYTATGNGLYSADAFVARVNQTGKVWWYRAGEADNFSLGTDRGVSVKVINNKVYWLAHGKGLNLRFNSVTYPRTQYSNNLSLLCQFSMDGTVDWVNVTKGYSQAAELAVHGNDILYIGFNLGVSTPIDFGNNVTISYTQGSLFAVKFNNTGAAQWAVVYDNDNSINSYSGAAIDDNGDLYVCGLSSKWTFSYGIRASSGYLVKISGTDGKQIWTRVSNFGIKGPVFSNGKIYMAGNTNGSVFLQTNQNDSIEFKRNPATLGSEQWIASFDKNGNLSGSLKASVSGSQVGSTVEYLQGTNNRVMMVGIYSYGNVFGNVTLPMTGMNVGVYHIGFFNIPTGSSPSGLKNTTTQNLKPIYPNPAKDYVIIETADNTPIVSISLIDISGKKVVASQTIKHDNAILNTSNLNKGIYFVEVTTESGGAIKKIILD
jgi:hypothetical protein